MILTDSLHHQHDAEDDGFETFQLGDDGTFPNNPALRVILYRDAIAFVDAEPPAAIERVFQEHGWNGVWRNGIFFQLRNQLRQYHTTLVGLP